MPLIGCGLDRLEWYKVSEIIKKLFDALVEVNTDNERLNFWWRDTCYDKVSDLYEMCRQNF